MTRAENAITVVFKNENFLVVDKPENLNFHSETSAGLVVLVKQQLNLTDLYPVHRLDKMTSGLIVFVLNQSTAQAFQTLFEARLVEKYYLAISTEKPKKKQGWVKGDMVAARRGSWMLTKTTENPAITRFISVSIHPNERLYLVKPLTGKTHQIRVALKSIAAPIAGDKRYANLHQANQEDRGYLHAFALRFQLNDESFDFVSPPNSGSRFMDWDCQTQIKQWHQPWDCFI